MVDEYTSGGIRRKRPTPDEPFAKKAREERQARLRIPLREQVSLEGVHDDHDPTKADIRDREEDSGREKNARLRDKENGRYMAKREQTLEEWADKIDRKAVRDEIIAQRKARNAERRAQLSGGLPHQHIIADIVAPDAIISHVSKVEVRKGQSRKKPEPSLTQQLGERDVTEILPPKFCKLVEEGRRPGVKSK